MNYDRGPIRCCGSQRRSRSPEQLSRSPEQLSRSPEQRSSLSSLTRRVPEPSSSRSQQRQRQGCPPMRNGWTACRRRTRRLRPAEKGAPTMGGEARAGRREGAERRRRHARGPTEGWARARAGRTRNMLCMFVTVDVSKLSVWLNADATCRVEGRAYDAGRGADREVGGCEAAAAQVACTRKARLKAGGQGTRGAHVEHVFHGCGLGRVKAQRL